MTRRARILRILRDPETNRMVDEIRRLRAEREALAQLARDRAATRKQVTA